MKLVSLILESPRAKVVISSVLPVLTGVFSGAFVNQITDSGRILWGNFYLSPSFYLLIGVTALIVLINKAAFNRDLEIERFSDEDYCVAYMRSKCLPEIALKYQEIIKSGDGMNINQLMKELKKSLK